jgi:hypothetical protein
VGVCVLLFAPPQPATAAATTLTTNAIWHLCDVFISSSRPVGDRSSGTAVTTTSAPRWLKLAPQPHLAKCRDTRLPVSSRRVGLSELGAVAAGRSHRLRRPPKPDARIGDLAQCRRCDRRLRAGRGTKGSVCSSSAGLRRAAFEVALRRPAGGRFYSPRSARRRERDKVAFLLGHRDATVARVCGPWWLAGRQATPAPASAVLAGGRCRRSSDRPPFFASADESPGGSSLSGRPCRSFGARRACSRAARTLRRELTRC